MKPAGRDRRPGLSLDPQQFDLEGFRKLAPLHCKVQMGPKCDHHIVGEHGGLSRSQHRIAELVHLGSLDFVYGSFPEAWFYPDAPMG